MVDGNGVGNITAPNSIRRDLHSIPHPRQHHTLVNTIVEVQYLHLEGVTGNVLSGLSIGSKPIRLLPVTKAVVDSHLCPERRLEAGLLNHFFFH